MNPISNFFFILTLLPHQLLITANPSNDSDLITSSCDHTLYKDFCKTSLQSSGDPHTNKSDLAVSALKLAFKKSIEISDHVKELLNTTSEPFMQQCLTDCSDSYADAIEQIEDSLTALNSKGYNDANMWVTAAMADADTCEDGFNDQPGHKSPLTDMKTNFDQLCSNALAIINLLPAEAGA